MTDANTTINKENVSDVYRSLNDRCMSSSCKVFVKIIVFTCHYFIGWFERKINNTAKRARCFENFIVKYSIVYHPKELELAWYLATFSPKVGDKNDLELTVAFENNECKSIVKQW